MSIIKLNKSEADASKSKVSTSIKGVKVMLLLEKKQ
jgi:hypothetical protein